MRLRHVLPALGTAALAVAVRTSAGFAARWSEAVSRPALRALCALGGALPFSLLEWGLLALALALFGEVCFRWGRSGAKRALGLLGRRLLGFLLAAAVLFTGLWLPLYPVERSAVCVASEAQLVACCEGLIDELNAAAPNFARVPTDLPAKRISFPGWMRALGITGLFSFPTGEALITPELPDCALPFVAVHERMHAEGIADEGAANVAAWEDCLARGGAYADSARVWALMYAMDELHARAPSAYATCRQRMSAATAAHFLAVGGGTHRRAIHPALRLLCAVLGIGESASDYDLLVSHLTVHNKP